jgi:Protein of unknown function (DUF3431)
MRLTLQLFITIGILFCVGVIILFVLRRGQQREAFSGGDYDIVVSQYKEDVSWLLPYAQNVRLYIKSGEKNESAQKLESAGAKISMLPNVGREAHTYLRYIIDNYDNLPTHVVFTQGSISDHYDMETFNSIVNLGSERMSKNYDTKYNDSKDTNWRLKEWKGELIPANMTLGEFQNKYIKREITGLDYPVYWAAIFSVKSSEIRKRSKQEYEDMIKPLEVGNNTEVAHFFERSWYYIFA